MAVKDKEVAEQKSTAVGQVLDFATDAGQGLEGADKNSFAIPFLTILQGLSPQCEPVKDGGVEGAKAGLFINSITNELFETILVIPCAFQRQFLRWAPRGAGGGYKGAYPAVDIDLRRIDGMSEHNGRVLMDVPKGESPFDDNGAPKFDYLSDTRNHFVLAQSKSGAWFSALLSLSSTQIKKSKKWLSLIQGIELKDANGNAYNPPSFSHIYKLSTTKEENAKGKWQGIQIEIERMINANDAMEVAVYQKAKKFHQDVIAGAVEVAPPESEATAAGDGETF